MAISWVLSRAFEIATSLAMLTPRNDKTGEIATSLAMLTPRNDTMDEIAAPLQVRGRLSH